MALGWTSSLAHRALDTVPGGRGDFGGNSGAKATPWVHSLVKMVWLMASVGARDPFEDATVTMIVPAYGVGAMIGDALRSLQSQDYASWVAIVVDDGDRAVAPHVEPFLADPRFRFLQTDNGGLSLARNRGMKETTTPFVGLLDGDDMLAPDFLSLMMAAFETAPDIGFVTCDASYFGEDRQGELFSSYCPQQLPASLERVLRRQFNVFSQTVMRREAIFAIDGFDVSLKASEDLDAWVRLLELGWKLGYVPKPLVRYRRHKGQTTRNVLGMLETTLLVMQRARERLKGRPEEIAAAEMCDRLEKEIATASAFDLLHHGEVAAALAEFDRLGTDDLSPRWRHALRLMRVAPFLASPLLKLRRRI